MPGDEAWTSRSPRANVRGRRASARESLMQPPDLQLAALPFSPVQTVLAVALGLWLLRPELGNAGRALLAAIRRWRGR